MGEGVPTFRIDKEGNWHHEGVEVTHEGVHLYLYSLLQRDEEGNYYLETEGQRWPVEVEDVPFVVVGLTEVTSDQGDKELIIRLNDGTEERLEIESLLIKHDNVPYCRVKQGRFEARFNRNSYFTLAHYLQYDPDTDSFYLEYGGKRHYIG